MKCPDCDKGQQLAMFPRYAPEFKGRRRNAIVVTCSRCGGSGQVDEDTIEWILKGKKLREDRLSRGMTLRSEAKRLGISPSQLSRMERGVERPEDQTKAGNCE